METNKAIVQARKTPNAKNQKGNHIVYQITLPKNVVKATGWKKGRKIRIIAVKGIAILETTTKGGL